MTREDKLKNLSTGDLIDKLKIFPFESPEHNEIKMVLEERVAKKYPDQFVLCVLSKYLTHPKGFTNMASLEGVTSYKDLETYISPTLSFFENDEYKFIPRFSAEWNLSLKQINVFGFITDGEKFILLRKINNKEITMVGGHTDFTQEAYNMSQEKYLALNMQRELDEEVKHKNSIVVPEKPIALINTYDKFHDLFHMTLVYKIEVDNVDTLFKKISSGEPKKHEVVKFNNKEEILKEKKCHSWLTSVIEFNTPSQVVEVEKLIACTIVQ